MSASSPTLFLLGASHRTTPLELREKLALTDEKMAAFHGRLSGLPGLREYARVRIQTNNGGSGLRAGDLQRQCP